MKRIGLEKHVEVVAWAPFPSTDRERADEKSDATILEEAALRFGNKLIAVMIYEVEVIEFRGIIYRSQPLNQRRACFDEDLK